MQVWWPRVTPGRTSRKPSRHFLLPLLVHWTPRKRHHRRPRLPFPKSRPRQASTNWLILVVHERAHLHYGPNSCLRCGRRPKRWKANRSRSHSKSRQTRLGRRPCQSVRSTRESKAAASSWTPFRTARSPMSRHTFWATSITTITAAWATGSNSLYTAGKSVSVDQCFGSRMASWHELHKDHFATSRFPKVFSCPFFLFLYLPFILSWVSVPNSLSRVCFHSYNNECFPSFPSIHHWALFLS